MENMTQAELVSTIYDPSTKEIDIREIISQLTEQIVLEALRITIDIGKKQYSHVKDFYIELIPRVNKEFKNEQLQSVLQNFLDTGAVPQQMIMPVEPVPLIKIACPTPRFNQIVYKYHGASDHLELIWTVPEEKVAKEIYKNHESVTNAEYLKDDVFLFYQGKLDKKCLELNNEDITKPRIVLRLKEKE